MIDSLSCLCQGAFIKHRKNQMEYEIVCIGKMEIASGLMIDSVTMRDPCTGQYYTKSFDSVRMRYDKVA